MPFFRAYLITGDGADDQAVISSFLHKHRHVLHAMLESLRGKHCIHESFWRVAGAYGAKASARQARTEHISLHGFANSEFGTHDGSRLSAWKAIAYELNSSAARFVREPESLRPSLPAEGDEQFSFQESC
jgi:hypothetical protein